MKNAESKQPNCVCVHTLLIGVKAMRYKIHKYLLSSFSAPN